MADKSVKASECQVEKRDHDHVQDDGRAEVKEKESSTSEQGQAAIGVRLILLPTSFVGAM
jgi:hypothetical protein